MTTTDRRDADDATFAAEMDRLDRLEVADPWRDQIADVLLAATTEYGAGAASPEVDLFDFYADALIAALKPAPGTDSSGRQPWRWHREPGTGDEWDRVWKCCDGPYDEAPAGHYADCPGTDSSGQATCGHLSPSINFGGDGEAERFMCELPHGHGGAHQRDNGDGLPPMRWIEADSSGQAVQRVLDLAEAWDAAADRADNPSVAYMDRHAAARIRAAVAGPQRAHGGEGDRG